MFTAGKFPTHIKFCDGRHKKHFYYQILIQSTSCNARAGAIHMYMYTSTISYYACYTNVIHVHVTCTHNVSCVTISSRICEIIKLCTQTSIILSTNSVVKLLLRAHSRYQVHVPVYMYTWYREYCSVFTLVQYWSSTHETALKHVEIQMYCTWKNMLHSNMFNLQL